MNKQILVLVLSISFIMIVGCSQSEPVKIDHNYDNHKKTISSPNDEQELINHSHLENSTPHNESHQGIISKLGVCKDLNEGDICVAKLHRGDVNGKCVVREDELICQPNDKGRGMKKQNGAENHR
ncbi:hypothetical protein HN419_04590 [Candidatus Woesearchaeota archaeon]|nr:hypothetical protein [Candidatus Woesearchaeota archaeon]MBT3537846.1 hypothetical protein [Candidatus Woesearchaeota archaeon]MBT4697977.1 hypothetical protein [Candidatus Woesearchaeota archaeon]MBT7105515.1 hypothetical protein [Candidatus Woesearchaeota archaeon]MBT7931705.1 hypothetical protein [Candidatus Woesearchaeota archaeon]